MKLRLPLFILIEGIDGSGKSTLSKALCEYYLEKKIPVTGLREPTGGKWGMKIREMLGGSLLSGEEQLKLFLNDREEDVEKNILPALNNKEMIIMDRYYYSNAAYQGAMGISPWFILDENRKKKFPEPDRIYFIDIDPDMALERIFLRNKSCGNNEVFEKKQFLEKVRNIYYEIADEKFYKINGDDSIENLLRQIIKDIEKNFHLP